MVRQDAALQFVAASFLCDSERPRPDGAKEGKFLECAAS